MTNLKKEKTRIAIIGAGGICYYAHLPSFALIKDKVDVAFLCDIKPAKAQWNKDEFKLDCGIIADYRDVLKREDIDAVDICTPNHLHSIIAAEALLAGKHVFCEKPDAVSVDEVLRMQQAADQSGKVLMVMRNNRYLASSEYMKKYIEKGLAGEIYAGRCGWIRRRGIPGKGGWFTTKSLSGGGPLIDLGVHMIDLAVWLMGNPKPVAVCGNVYRKFADDQSISDSDSAKFGETEDGGIFDVEDLAMGLIRFENGACLQIEFSWASNISGETSFVELRGEKAGFTWKDGKIEIYSEDQGYPLDLKPYTEGGLGGHERNIHHFIDVIRDGAKPQYDVSQGLDMIRILTALYRSAQTGKEVVL